MKQLQVDIALSLDRFDLEIEFVTRKPVTGVFGPSGSGKTSLLEAIAGLRGGARGRIQFDGAVWLDSQKRYSAGPEHRRVGYVPQDGLLFPHLDVRENLLAGWRRARERGSGTQPSVEVVIGLLELAPLLARDVRTLSGGERQRVALGRALCSGPEILLLDEPLASLDLPLRRRLLPLLRRVRAELTIPMLLVSHDPIEVQALCDEVIVLREGRAVGRGEPSEVLTDPLIFPLTELEAFVNVLPARLTKRFESSARVQLGGDGVELVTLATDAEAGDDVLLGLPASQILIATERPRGLSARNALAATVIEVRSLGGMALVRAQLSKELPPLIVEVTEATPAKLDLVPGREVFLVVKAIACRLYGSARIPATSGSRDPLDP